MYLIIWLKYHVYLGFWELHVNNINYGIYYMYLFNDIRRGNFSPSLGIPNLFWTWNFAFIIIMFF